MTRYLLAAVAAATLAVPAAPASADSCTDNVVECAIQSLCVDCLPPPPVDFWYCTGYPVDDVLDMCIWSPWVAS
jgi:hypothetical protein